MIAVTTGSLHDGLTMDDYYPGLRAQGYFRDPGSAGPFDTGTRCGAKVQLIASLNLLCRDDVFQFTQTVHHDRSIINGAKDGDDGKTRNDVADSGLDFSKPPHRQAVAAELPGPWLGAAPQELHVSMADPPSLLYSAVRNAEWDRTFVTGLAGPRGKLEVTWRSSIAVRDGKVVKNTVG
jgi:hypothetical protein